MGNWWGDTLSTSGKVVTSPSSSLAKCCGPPEASWGTWSISALGALGAPHPVEHLRAPGAPWGHLGHLISWSISRLQGHLLPRSTSFPGVPQARPLATASPSIEHRPPRAGLLTSNIFPPQAIVSCLAGSLAGASGQFLQLGQCTCMYPSWKTSSPGSIWAGS